MLSDYLGDCIKFHDDSTSRLYVKNNPHIKVIRDTGCWSNTGMFQSGQEISLDYNCLNQKTIQHEFTHALGFLHEQSRPDRDNYLNIHQDAIEASNQYNYFKLPENQFLDLSEQYDPNSAMHYKYHYFQTAEAEQNNRPTMTYKINGEPVDNEATRLSSVDVIQIAKRYKNYCSLPQTVNCSRKDFLGLRRYVLRSRICDGICDCPSCTDENSCEQTGSFKIELIKDNSQCFPNSWNSHIRKTLTRERVSLQVLIVFLSDCLLTV